MIHDEVVARNLWPGSEPVDRDEYRDLSLLDSAVNRPFQSFDGADLYPSLAEKAAALFHSLSCNHCFHNGNKRTALVALDMFLAANQYAFLASNEEAYRLAKATAAHNERGVSARAVLAEITAFIGENTIAFSELRTYAGEHQDSALTLYRIGVDACRWIRAHPLNNPHSD